MHKYHYTGAHEVELTGYGLVQPGETIETNVEINHPEFELVDGHKPIEEKKEQENIQHHQEEQQEEIKEESTNN